MPAGVAQCPVPGLRMRTKSMSQSSAEIRTAGAASGPAAKKPRNDAVFERTPAPARFTRSSRGAQSAQKAMATHLSSLSLGPAQVSDIWSRVGAAGFLENKDFSRLQNVQRKAIVCTKSQSQSSATQRSAGVELGGAAKKLGRAAASDATAGLLV